MKVTFSSLVLNFLQSHFAPFKFVSFDIKFLHAEKASLSGVRLFDALVIAVFGLKKHVDEFLFGLHELNIGVFCLFTDKKFDLVFEACKESVSRPVRGRAVELSFVVKLNQCWLDHLKMN
jgi:hypothetical protein